MSGSKNLRYSDVGLLLVMYGRDNFSVYQGNVDALYTKGLEERVQYGKNPNLSIHLMTWNESEYRWMRYRKL